MLLALLRWRARQDTLGAVWAQAAARAPEGREAAAARAAGRYLPKQQRRAGPLNRQGRPRKARVVDSAHALASDRRGTDAEASLEADLRGVEDFVVEVPGGAFL